MFAGCAMGNQTLIFCLLYQIFRLEFQIFGTPNIWSSKYLEFFAVRVCSVTLHWSAGFIGEWSAGLLVSGQQVCW